MPSAWLPSAPTAVAAAATPAAAFLPMAPNAPLIFDATFSTPLVALSSIPILTMRSSRLISITSKLRQSLQHAVRQLPPR